MTNFQKMLAFMREQLGKLYDLGDHGPDKWDCSGIVLEMIKRVMGWIWSHSSHYQYYDNIKPGGKLTEYGTLDTMPKDKDCLLFKYGERTSGKGKGMIHVGAYDGKTKTELQAGGKGPIVQLEAYEKCILNGMTPVEAVNNSLAKNHPGGTRKSVVWEQAFHKSHWTHWARGLWMDAAAGAEPEPVPTQDTAESGNETLRKGAAGTVVVTLQNLLNAWNAEQPGQAFDALEADGKFGALTYQAVREYQEQSGLFVDGIVGPKTWGALLEEAGQAGAAPETESPDSGAAATESTQRATLRLSSRGDDVRTLQEMLNGYLQEIKAAQIKVDGIFGPFTLGAVLSFQKHTGIRQDGVCGPITWGKFEELTAK